MHDIIIRGCAHHTRRWVLLQIAEILHQAAAGRCRHGAGDASGAVITPGWGGLGAYVPGGVIICLSVYASIMGLCA